MPFQFTNWSGSLTFTADERATPGSTEEVAEVVRRAAEQGRTVRPVGEGHSSTPLARTDDVLLSLDRMSGVTSTDPERGRARVLPGTRLNLLGDQLAEQGLSMENMGDVDLQAIAGAISTGTHGSGRTLGNLSQMLVGAELVTAAGDVVRLGEDADGEGAGGGAGEGGGGVDGVDGVDGDELLRCAQVSLGALGVLTSLTLRLLPAHSLTRKDWCTPLAWALDHFDEMAEQNRSFDMYWYPRSDEAQVRTLNLPDEPPELEPDGALTHNEEVGPNHEIIPKSRDMVFDEMEYMLPYDAGLACFQEVRERIKERHRRTVAWRVLLRTVAADRSPLSNCYGRPTMTIALLHNAGLPYEEYFGDLEPVLRSYGGRPHWGKKHSLRAADLEPLLPEWDTFRRVRRALDPDGVFLNDHLRELLEDG